MEATAGPSSAIHNMGSPDDSTEEGQRSAIQRLWITVTSYLTGVIINSVIYLPKMNWNCMLSIDDNVANKYCGLCDMYIATVDVNDHINEDRHKNQREHNLPLQSFELNIITRIKDVYHCGVCNEVINENGLANHISEQRHQEQKSSSMEKVSDPTTRHNLTGGNTQNDEIVNRLNPDATHSNNTTYALITSTPMDLRRAWIDQMSNDSYNMLAIVFNWFYCLVCNVFGETIDKMQHCHLATHMACIERCQRVILTHFGRYNLLRKIRDNICHCGHCNSVHIETELENHIRTIHIRVIRNMVDETFVSNRNRTSNSPSGTINFNNANTSNNSRHKGKWLRDDEVIKLNIFKCDLTVSLLAYNTLVRKCKQYYCRLCSLVVYPKDLWKHINQDKNHKEKMQNTPLIEVFHINLFRLINNSFYCTLCNLQNIIDPLYHMSTAAHQTFLDNAKVPARPPTETNIVVDGSSNNDQTRNIPSNNAENNENISNDANNRIDRNRHLIDEIAFDVKEYVYVRMNNVFVKITKTSYNSLMPTSGGNRYCFVCMSHVYSNVLNRHVNSRAHMESMKQCKFVDKYAQNLMRQWHTKYHCGICNVMVPRKFVENHLTWPTHEMQKKNLSVIRKNSRRKEIKAGMRLYDVDTQMENVYLNDNDMSMKICLDVNIVSEPGTQNCATDYRKKKLLCAGVTYLNVLWLHWNGLIKKIDGFKCTLCDKRFSNNTIDRHVQSQSHKNLLTDFEFEKKYSYNLIRKITENKLHCIVCNTNLNNGKLLEGHINGKKHKDNYQNLVKTTEKDIEKPNYVDFNNVFYL